jgi:hypothetical protein
LQSWSARLVPLAVALLLARASEGQVSRYEVVSATDGPGETTGRAVEAVCPEGKRLLGGGAAILGTLTGTALTASTPDGPDGSPDRWFAAARDDGADSWSLRARAVCGAIRGYAAMTSASDAGVFLGIGLTAPCPSPTLLGGGARISGVTLGASLTRIRFGTTALLADARDDGFDPWSLEATALCGDLDVELVTESDGPGVASTRSVAAVCPAGTVAIGGATAPVGNVRTDLHAFGPDGEGGAWTAVASTEDSNSWSLEVTAVCPEPQAALSALACAAGLLAVHARR